MVHHGKASARGVAVFIQHEVNAEFIISNFTQQPCKDELRRKRQALPVGPIVAAHLDFESLALPVRQGGAQGTFGLGLAGLAVQIFKAGLECRFRGLVEIADQHRFPVVPCPRPNPANVTNGQRG